MTNNATTPDYGKDTTNAPTAKKSDLGEVHSEALKRYQAAYDKDKDNIRASYDDLRFVAGDQWDIVARRERIEEGRPCLTINRLPQFIKQITGDIRMSKPGIKAVPVDDDSDPQTAEVIEGIIRQIENTSDAKSAYYNGVDSQVSAGIGHWRVTWDYAQDDSFDMDLKILPIRNGIGVLWDPTASLATREDAMWCFVPVDMSIEAFKAKYPDQEVSDVPETDTGITNLWISEPGMTRVAEYWVKEPTTKTLAQLDDGRVLDITDMDKTLRAMLGAKRVEDRPSHKVCRYIISGSAVLDGPEDCPGRYIPIIPAMGEEVNLEDQTVRLSAIRHAKDPQMAYNFWRTAQTEFVALQPKAPFIGTDKNFKKYAALWSQANRKAVPYLPYEPDPANGGAAPQRSAPPMSSAGMMEGVSIAAEDMKSTTGIYDAALGAQSNETSGKAILARDRQGDVSTYVYFDNFARAVAHTGRIIVDLIPFFYDTTRIVRVLGKDGTEQYLKVNNPINGPDGGGFHLDLTTGKYDVVMESGPSYTTKRAEAADGMMQFMQSVPAAAPLVMDLFAKMQDWPFHEELAQRLKSLLPPAAQQADAGQIGPDGQPMPPQPSPQEQEQEQMAQQGRAAEVAEQAAKAQKAQADAEKSQADAAKARTDAQIAEVNLAILMQSALQPQQPATEAAGTGP